MPIGYTSNKSNNTDYQSIDEKDDNVCVCWGGGGGGEKSNNNKKGKR